MKKPRLPKTMPLWGWMLWGLMEIIFLPLLLLYVGTVDAMGAIESQGFGSIRSWWNYRKRGK